MWGCMRHRLLLMVKIGAGALLHGYNAFCTQFQLHSFLLVGTPVLGWVPYLIDLESWSWPLLVGHFYFESDAPLSDTDRTVLSIVLLLVLWGQLLWFSNCSSCGMQTTVFGQQSGLLVSVSMRSLRVINMRASQ
ncbi:unnamed protein product [Ostreobium quekettii]|uniref:Uncharacterized protein n=1 Tax=Ostreobium quekettii TaxID=121088 RepID=A0A8S1JA73_9CHLO|nr:unnamed protein product [Ostreobium quekettii]